MTKRCIELIRVSTSGQAADDKASIPSQKATNRQTEKAFGLTIVKTIEISDVSGAQVLLAPEIQEMLRLMNDPEIHGVIVREFSRLMRPDNFADYAMLQAFADSETILYLPEGPIDFSTDTGIIHGGMRAMMGGLEKRELVKKMWRIKEAKRQEGGFSQSPVCLPYGVSFNGSWAYTADAERAREAFRLVLAGNTSYVSIGASVGLQPFHVRKLLRNPIYTGWRVIDEKRDPSPRAKRVKAGGRQGDRPRIKRSPEEIIRVQVIKEPLISESQFNQVQRILDLKKANHWRVKGVEHRFTYNGYLRCECDRLIYTKYRRDDYYVCSAKCGVGYMRKDRLEPELNRLFSERLMRPRFLNQIVKGMRVAVPQADIQRLNDQMNELEKKRERILTAYFDGVINEPDRDLRIQSVDREQDALKRIVAKQKPRPELDVQTLAETFAPFAEFDMLNREDKRHLLNTITPTIIAANYQIKGLWIGIEGSDNRLHTVAGYQRNEDSRHWLPIGIAA